MTDLFTIQTVEKYENSVLFIRQALQPYRDNLAVLPSKTPETVKLKLKIQKKDPPIIHSIICSGKELLVDAEEEEEAYSRVWTLSYRKFNLDKFKGQISSAWHVPGEQLEILCDENIPENLQLRLPEGKTIKQPYA